MADMSKTVESSESKDVAEKEEKISADNGQPERSENTDVQESSKPEEKISEQTNEPDDHKNSQNDSPKSVYDNFGYDVKDGIQLLERPVLEALALQRLEQILNPGNEVYDPVCCNYRARAMLIPIGQKVEPPAFMNYKTFTIGIGSDQNLPLSKYGHCDFVSSKHAIIFYDEVRAQ